MDDKVSICDKLHQGVCHYSLLKKFEVVVMYLHV